MLRIALLSGKFICRWLARAAAVVAAGSATGQVVYESTEAPAEVVEEVRRYQVEMVVFEHNDGRQTVNELFLPDIEPQSQPQRLQSIRPGQMPEIGRIGPVVPAYGDPGTVFNPASTMSDRLQPMDRNSPEYRRWLAEQPLTEVPSHILQTRLKVLDAETYAMPDVYRTLQRLGAYTPIMRAAWIQAVHEKDDTLPIELRRLGSPPLYLDGEVTLYLSRFLHLVVDVTIDAGDTVLEASDADAGRFYGDARTQNYFDRRYDIPTAPLRYRISEDRIFRTGETRYYDHPRFGVVARVTRVEEDDGQAPETDEDVLTPAN